MGTPLKGVDVTADAAPPEDPQSRTDRTDSADATLEADPNPAGRFHGHVDK